MSETIFILLILICIGLIYIVHKYFTKQEFYLLITIYSVISFLFSFKLVNIFSLDINLSIITTSGLYLLLYYFINRYGKEEIKKFIIISMISTISTIIIMLITSFMIPSIYDESVTLFKELITENLSLIILYPINLFITYLLLIYSFKEINKIKKNKNIKSILILIGTIFIDTLISIYFNYSLIIDFDKARLIAINNYLIKVIIIIIYYLYVNKILKIKKVKQ